MASLLFYRHGKKAYLCPAVSRMHMKSLLRIMWLLLPARMAFGQTVAPPDTTRYARQYDLQEITVEQSRRARLSGISSGRIVLHTEGMKAVPSLMGMPDVLKVLELTPGVQTSGEGQSNIYVRGGDPGQTLLTYADIPVYTPGHALNIFPLFNADHLTSVELVKGGVPAAYGNFLAGAINTRPIDRVPAQTSVTGSVGLLASQATLALRMGPRWGAYLSARKTYMNYLLNPLIRLTSGTTACDEIEEMGYDFDDLNATLVGHLGSRSRLHVNFFGGRDRLRLSEQFIGMTGTMPWFNLGASAAVSTEFDDHTGMEHSLVFSRFGNELSLHLADLSVQTRSRITTAGYSGKLHFRLAGLPWEGGVQYRLHRLFPQEFDKWQGDLFPANLSYGMNRAHEASAFLGTKLELFRRLTLEPGVRYTFFHSALPARDVSKGFHSVDARLAARYRLTDTQYLRATFSRNTQYIGKLFPSSTGLPTDFWVAASPGVLPQHGVEASAGYYCALLDGMLEVSADLYYRSMRNVAEYNHNFIENDPRPFTETLLFGRGQAYGLELMLKKNYGNFTGWLSYTLGRSERRFPGIDNGRPFPARHDRTHDLSLTGTYTLNAHWDFSLTQVFATGNAYTAPSSWYFIGNTPVKEYGPYNGSRLPAYNRTDLGINYWFKPGNGINLSVYNLFAIHNPLYVILQVSEVGDSPGQVALRMKRRALFTIMPSISWRFRF